MSKKDTHLDAFNLMCGKFLGEGIHRKVFECRLRPDLVVKVESDYWRFFANTHECKFWDDNKHASAIAKWLAPCEFLSPDGRILLQRRVDPIKELPDKLPAFLTDHKPENFGLLDGRVVCVDYASVIVSPSVRMRKSLY